jgi:phosphopantothenoylcysteine decarboxylase
MRGSAGAKRRRPRILIGVTGSVAAVKVPELCAELCKFAQLKVVFTQSSRHFFERAADYNSAAWEEWKKVVVQPELCEIVTDEEEWASWGKVGDAVTHIAVSAALSF